MTRVVATYNDGSIDSELYMETLPNIVFKKDINNALVFGSIREARNAITRRFISISNWIALYNQGNPNNGITGLYIYEYDSKGLIVGRHKYI